MTDRFLTSTGTPPLISPSAYKGVSDWRRNELEKEASQGLISDGSGRTKNGLTNASFVVSSSSGIPKFANGLTAAQSAGMGWRGGNGEAVFQSPEIYNPLFLTSNINFPRDRASINAWCRTFFALNAIVQNAIQLHSTYPISKLSIKCPNKKVERFFNDMIEDIDLLNVCIQVAQEFWLLGEAFVYAELDQTTAKWSRLIIQNPDYIVVKRSVIASEPIIMLRPDENLRNIVKSNKPADIEQRNQLNETIVQHVKRGENIPLSNFYVSHLARKISPYEVRGTGLPVSIFRQLLLFDSIRECKYAQTSDMINPITLIKLGTAGEYKPTHADLEAWRNEIEAGFANKNFKIITHEGVTIERIGAGAGIYDTSADITQLIKEMYVGLMVPQVVMDGGGDITYSNGGVSLDVLRQRYMSFRSMMTNWLRKKIFAPISKLNEFYEYEDGEQKLIIPDVEWNQMSLFDTGDYIDKLVNLTTGEQKKVSIQTLYRSLGLEYEEERRKMRREDIEDAIRKKEQASLDRMPLNELRALGEDDEINEIAETALPFQSPYSDAGGAPPGEAGGLGGLPPLPGGGSGGGGGLDLGTPPAPSGGAEAPPAPPPA